MRKFVKHASSCLWIIPFPLFESIDKIKASNIAADIKKIKQTSIKCLFHVKITSHDRSFFLLTSGHVADPRSHWLVKIKWTLL